MRCLFNQYFLLVNCRSRDNCSAKICKQPEEIRNNTEETQQNNSLHVPYQQFRNCAQKEFITKNTDLLQR